MKKISFLFLLLFATTFGSMAQDNREVVYLTDGSIVKGLIIELIPDDYLKIETANGKTHIIEMYEVEKITKEMPENGTQNNRKQNINQHNNNRYLQRNDSDYHYDDYNLPRNNTNFGAKTGGTLSNMAMEGLKNKIGFQGGVFAEFKFNKFAIQPELLFSMQGAKADYEDFDDYNAKINLTYLNIPVMAKFYVVDGLCFETGPQLGILLSAKGKAEVEGVGGSVDAKKLINNIDFSINFGASYQIPGMPLGFYARYSLGLTDIAKDIEPDEEAGKNRVFQVGAFVKF